MGRLLAPLICLFPFLLWYRWSNIIDSSQVPSSSAWGYRPSRGTAQRELLSTVALLYCKCLVCPASCDLCENRSLLVWSRSGDGRNHDLWEGTVTFAPKEDWVCDRWPCLNDSATGPPTRALDLSYAAEKSTVKHWGQVYLQYYKYSFFLNQF